MDKIHFEVSELNMDIINNIFGKNDDATIEEYLTSEAVTNMAKVVGFTSGTVSVDSIRSKLTGTTDVLQNRNLLVLNLCALGKYMEFPLNCTM